MNYYHVFTQFIPFLGKDLFGGAPICGTSPPWDHVDHDGVQPTEFWATRDSRYPHPTNKCSRFEGNEAESGAWSDRAAACRVSIEH